MFLALAGEPSNFSGYAGSIKRLLSNWGYVLLLISYGLNVGVFYAISTLLNTVIVKHFKVQRVSQI
jgi:FLVCR family feline leukemia virus subgroup C receptor-related protein